MKYFIVEMTYRAPIETIRENYTAHRSWLQKGYDQDLFLCSGPKSDPPVGGYLLARANSKSELEGMFVEEPLCKAGLGTLTFTEFQPVKRASWAEAWFNGEDGVSGAVGAPQRQD